MGPRWPNIDSYDEELNPSRTAKRLRRLPLHRKAGGLTLQVQPWSESLHAGNNAEPKCIGDCPCNCRCGPDVARDLSER